MTTEYLNNRIFEEMIGRFQTSKKLKARYKLIIEDIEDAHSRKLVRNNVSDEDKEQLQHNKMLHHAAETDYHNSRLQLASAFYTLSENIVRFAKFDLIDDEDAVQEGVMTCFDKIDKFDSRKGKAFNYMTTCILNHFRQLYRTARNYNELKKRYHDFIELKMSSTMSKQGKPVMFYQSK